MTLGPAVVTTAATYWLEIDLLHPSTYSHSGRIRSQAGHCAAYVRLDCVWGYDYTALPVPGASWDDLNPLEFERARQVTRRYRGDSLLLALDDQDMAKALGAVEANGEVRRVTVAGMLVFGREETLARWVPTHEVAFQVLAGTRVEVNGFFRWPLIRLSEELAARFATRRREHELQDGPYRVPVPEYDERCFREAVHNALLHRD